MRRTVTLDPDTEQIVRARMASAGVSLERALNDAIRARATSEPEAAPYRVPSFSMGKPKVDLTKALQVSGDLEDEHTVGVILRGR